jgi:hypothetical protein
MYGALRAPTSNCMVLLVQGEVVFTAGRIVLWVLGAGRREADGGATLLCYGDFAGGWTKDERSTTGITKS